MGNFLMLQNPRNNGFAAGCNLGIAAALDRNAQFVWLLNNDAQICPGAYEALKECAAERPRAIIGATVVDAENRTHIQAAGGVRYCPATTWMTPAHAGEPLEATPQLSEPRMDYIYGASVFLPAAFFRAHEGLDEMVFLYFEELDLCRRAMSEGYALHWCRRCVVLHQGGAATGVTTGRVDTSNAIACFHETRSSVLFTRKHYPWLLPVVLLVRTLGKSCFLAWRRQWALIPSVFRGALQGLGSRPASRTRLQNVRNPLPSRTQDV